MIKLKYCIVLILILCMSESIHAQHITLHKSNVTLKELIDNIKSVTGKSFFFAIDDVQMDKKFTVNFDKKSLPEVLEVIFPSETYECKIKESSIVISQKDKKTDKVISGNVTDENGEPLVGVSITSTISKRGTITDMDGNYSISVVPGDELEFSYIGFQPYRQKTGGNSNVSITMKEDRQLLDEVVVIGYGTQKKTNLTGAIGYVGGEDLTNRPVATLGQALQGAVPNMNITFDSGKPGESANINIRGAGSITSGNDKPLILIDGVEGSLNDVNPRDVESISVLKDASSAAIYGARAAFGVVLVTTKSTKEGKMKVSYNGRFSVSNQTTSSDFVTTGYDAAIMVNEFLRSYNGNTYTVGYTQDDIKMLEERRYDKTEHPDRPWVTVAPDGKYKYYANFDWYNYLIDASRPTQDHNVSLSGGNEKISYNVSANYYTQKGIYVQQPDRYTSGKLRARIKAQVTPWLEFTLTSSLNATRYKAPGLGQGNNIPNYTFHAMPFLVPKNPDGTNVFQTGIINEQPTDGVHIMVSEGQSYSDTRGKTFLNTANTVFKLYKGLTLNANYSYKKYYKDEEYRTNTGTFSRYQGVIETAESSLLKNKLRQTCYSEDYHVVDAYLSYNETFGNHHVSGVAGMNYEQFSSKKFYATKMGIQSDILNDFNLGENTSVELSGGQNEYAIMGIFGRLGYDYKGKYLAEFNVRRDATSRFPRKDRSGWFPSISAGWRISDEPFFKPLNKVVSNFKIRGSYGTLGNQKIKEFYPYMQTMNVASMDNYILDGAIASYTLVDRPLSASLTWESIYSTNLGVDLGFLNGRLSLSGDIYRRDTKGMLMDGFELPKVYGALEPLENGAELRTKGYELTLKWNDNIKVSGKNFNYYISATLADNTTKVTKYQQNPDKKLDGVYEGMEWGEIWGYQVDGLFASDEEAAEYQSRIDQTYVSQNIFIQAQGAYRGLQAGDINYADLNGDKKINNGINTLDDHGDLKKIGNSKPRYTYSSTVGFDWFGIDCSAFFQGIGRQHIYPGGNCMLFWGGYARPYGSFIPTTLAGDMWTPENPDGYFPKQRGYSAQGNRSLAQKNDRYLQNLAYCRLKNFTIGYTIPQNWTKKINIERLRIYFSGDNLVTWTKLRSDYIDPEQFAKDGDARVYPYPKTFSFGIDITLY